MQLTFAQQVGLVLLMCALGLTSCKQRNNSSEKYVEGTDFLTEFAQEVIPYNRLPINVLREDESLFKSHDWALPPDVQKIQNYKGTDYGIRLISPNDFWKYVKPGDIALDYVPIVDPKDIVLEGKMGRIEQKSTGEKPEQEDIGLNHMILVGLGEQGMSHAKLVMDRGGKLCHVDSPDVMSDCNWDGYAHFFRVDVDESVKDKVADMARTIFKRRPSYDYDSFLYTDVYVKGVSSVDATRKLFEAGKLAKFPPLYCSELPFTLYSVAMGHNLFETNFNLIDFSEQIAALKSEPKFAPYVDQKIMQQSFAAFVQQASTVPENLRPMLNAGIKQMLADGYIGGGMRYMIRKYYPPVVLPRHFMMAAREPEKVPGTRVVYIGSIENPSVKRDNRYYSTMIYAVGKNAINNYLQRVREWWSSPVAPDSMEESTLQLNSVPTDNGPTYLEPKYSN